MSHLDILSKLYPCTRKIWTTSLESYLQFFSNNLPNIFTNGVIYLSVLLCQKQWRYHFQNHSTPNKRRRCMVTRKLASYKLAWKIVDWHLMDSLSKFQSLWSSRVNIFTSNIGYIEPIIQSPQCRHFYILKSLTPTGSRPKVLGKSVLMLTSGQIKDGNWGELLSLKQWLSNILLS